MKSLSHAQLTSLLHAAKADTVCPLAHLAILTAFSHALRASEVCALTAADIKDGFITVQRLKGSMRTTQPLVRSSDPLYDESPLIALAQTLPSGGRLFPFSRVTFWRAVQRAGRAAGLPAHLCHPHAAKHTCAKLAIAGGIRIDELKQYLGHVSLASTGAYLASDDQSASLAFAAAMGAGASSPVRATHVVVVPPPMQPLEMVAVQSNGRTVFERPATVYEAAR